MLYLASVSLKLLNQVMKKYVVIGLMNIYCSKPSDKINPNIICIIFWRILYVVSIKEEIPPNPPFQF